MEIEKTNKRIFNENLKKLMGSFIESWPEPGGHITIFYGVKKANIANQKCTICNSSPPEIIRYERDHWAQEFYDALCKNCTPKRILDNLRGKGG